MKLLCWNILHGGGKRGDAILERIISHDADVVILTEYRRNATGTEIMAELAAQGWHHQADSMPPHRMNGVMAASRFPIAVNTSPFDGTPDSHLWLHFTVEGTEIFGVYFPGMEGKKPHWEKALTLADELSNKPAVILGDVNTGSRYSDEVGATFVLPEYIDRLVDKGWPEAWRLLHPDGREYTWYSNAGNGFRIDHAYLSPILALRLQTARYSHTERENRISDHSAFIVEFED